MMVLACKLISMQAGNWNLDHLVFLLAIGVMSWTFEIDGRLYILFFICCFFKVNIDIKSRVYGKFVAPQYNFAGQI